VASVLALDLATRKTGYCVGDGTSVPVAGAWLFPQVGAQYGRLGAMLWEQLNLTETRFPDLELVVVEAPIMTARDKLDTVRKLYGVSFMVETWCSLRSQARIRAGLDPIDCRESDLRRIKRDLAGFSGADKNDMVAAALKVGIELPKTKDAGREDAADAFGAWLGGIRAMDRRLASEWDRRLWRSRGATLV
jgi:hypothetical protein